MRPHIFLVFLWLSSVTDTPRLQLCQKKKKHSVKWRHSSVLTRKILSKLNVLGAFTQKRVCNYSAFAVLCVRLQQKFCKQLFPLTHLMPRVECRVKLQRKHDILWIHEWYFYTKGVSQSLTLVIYSVLVAHSKTTILHQKMSTTIPQSFTISYRMMDQWWKRTLKAPKCGIIFILAVYKVNNNPKHLVTRECA